MSIRTKVALLLFGSGLCALIYQTAWLREFRLIFGASTAASAAVLAIFMGGLGYGSLILGARADRHPKPLMFYGQLELLIAGSAALTPILIWLVRHLYIGIGGTELVGLTVGTVLRLLLAALVLAIPTFLMGGTLPAAARAVETADDQGRRTLALLYGANTLGAVTGTLLSTFFMLEIFGNRQTLWVAALVNVLVALAARWIARTDPELVAGTDVLEDSLEPAPMMREIRPIFILSAASVTGFSFLLMEIVWYRMLSPLLGGSTFTFGLILAVALLGIGMGGMAYSFFGRNRAATLHLFAVTSALEAVFVALPFALGDRIAVLTLLLRHLGSIGFGGYIIGWVEITLLVVFPAAFIAGVQFPMLIALLGSGRKRVGVHVGQVYAWNTAGAIAGSLAGGFGLLPFLTAPGTWRLVVVLLAILAAASIAYSSRAEGADTDPGRRNPSAQMLSLGLITVSMMMILSIGPTAVWRHSGIGAGRATRFEPSRNGIRDWVNRRRRTIQWEAEGVESSVALSVENGLAFLINGKTDGHARGDAPTQVMSGLIGGLIHANPKQSLVIGLGTGSSAGWLAAIPTMERVDAVELEPAVIEVARACAVVNQNVMERKNVFHTIGDAREVLLTTRRRYDLIFSEPSNPYRAGIASLFTREFYQAATNRLTETGVFLQWLQTYEVDSDTIRTIYATLGSVFPHVETWQTKGGDLVLAASMKPFVYDVPRLRRRIQEEPFRSALYKSWRVHDVEGFMSHFVANDQFARDVAGASEEFINTDDRNIVEFGFARTMGSQTGYKDVELRRLARFRQQHIPETRGGQINWRAVRDRQLSMLMNDSASPAELDGLTRDQLHRAAARTAYMKSDYAGALSQWTMQSSEPDDTLELLMLAELLAESGDPTALSYIERLRGWQALEADVVLARFHRKNGDFDQAARSLQSAFVGYRDDPWPMPFIMDRALHLAVSVARSEKGDQAALRLYQALSKPFTLALFDAARKETLIEIARTIGSDQCNPHLASAHRAFEPHVPWNAKDLTERARCSMMFRFPEAEKAQEDLATFLAAQPSQLGQSLPDLPSQ